MKKGLLSASNMSKSLLFTRLSRSGGKRIERKGLYENPNPLGKQNVEVG